MTEYDNHKSTTWHFNKFKEAVEFLKIIRKANKNCYFCLYFDEV